jgi:hypothetical protein
MPRPINPHASRFSLANKSLINWRLPIATLVRRCDNRRNASHPPPMALDMKQRLKQAGIMAAIGAAVGVGLSLYMKSDQMLGITIACALVAFFFGFAFKLQPG